MFSEIKKQHLIIFVVMLAILFGGGVKYGRYLSEENPPPVEILPAEKQEENGKEAQVSKDVIVHVTGAVCTPGVYTLKEGSRVTDAVSLAKPMPEADLEALNLAKKLADQEKVMVPYLNTGTDGTALSGNTNEAVLNAAAPGKETFSSIEGSLININTAGEAELESLPGIGPSKANAIIQYREENGFFSCIEDIDKVPGIGPATFNNLKDMITV